MSQVQAPDVADAPEPLSPGEDLKYLGFIPCALGMVTTYIVSLYELAKDSTGPLKPGVDSVEGTVKTVVGPVYQKVEGKPHAILVFIDGKIDGAVIFLDGVLPPKWKEFGTQAYDAAKTAAADVQKEGVYTTAKGYFDKYEPVAETYGIHAYKKALTVPLVPEAIAVARYSAVKVNHIIGSLKGSGLPLTSYLPLLPVSYFDKITQTQ